MKKKQNLQLIVQFHAYWAIQTG